MTRETFTPINSGELQTEIGKDKPIKESILKKLRNNQIAVSQQAPLGPDIRRFQSLEKLSGSGTWTVPAEIFRVKIFLSGGGGGGGEKGSSNKGGNGQTTTFGSFSAIGGRGTNLDSTPNVSNFKGFVGARGGISGIGSHGGNGVTIIDIISVEPGQQFSYSVGNGGSAGTSNDDRGSNGFIILEY